MSSSKVDKESPLPIYYQLKEKLKEEIEEGHFQAHERLPSERELENSYGISRMTARRALSELEMEGYVYREQGKGSFVAEPKFRQALLRLTGFTEDMHSRGLKPGSEVLDSTMIQGDSELREKLEANPEENFFRLQRIRLAEGEPLAIETAVIRYKLCPGIEEIDFNNRSLYETLQKQFSLNLSSANQTVEATLADEFEAETLEVQTGAPMLATERTTYLSDSHQPIEFTRSVYRGDRYRLFVELER